MDLNLIRSDLNLTHLNPFGLNLILTQLIRSDLNLIRSDLKLIRSDLNLIRSDLKFIRLNLIFIHLNPPDLN